MARRALMLFPLALLLMSNRGCETIDQSESLSVAKRAEAIASVNPSLPSLDPSCTAKTGRVYPTATEPRVMTQERWLTVVELRDGRSEDCAAWWASYRASLKNGGGAASE